LHQLTPAEQWEVKRSLGFATTEWQEGLSLSLHPVSVAFGESVHGEKNFGKLLASARPETAIQQRIRLTPDSEKIILCLVGLPARGKSLYGHKLETFLAWRGYKTKSFKVGAWRRGEREGQESGLGLQPSPNVGRRGLSRFAAQDDTEQPPAKSAPEERAPNSSASFFDSKKSFAAATRDKVSMDAFAALLNWLNNEHGEIGIFDACNVTIARRAKLHELINMHNALHPGHKIGMVFIESICTDAEVVQREMEIKVQMSDDFKGMPKTEALDDLQERIAHYEKTYQTVRAEEGSYIKIFDLRAKVHASNIYGRMAKSVLPYIMNVHILVRPVFLLCIDEAAANDSLLQSDGTPAAGLMRWLASYARSHELNILTSTQSRARAIGAAIAAAAGAPPPEHRAQLAPLRRDEDPDSPVRDGSQTGESFRKAFGERVSDLVMRLEPVVIEVEGSTMPVLLVAHEAACRALRRFLINDTVRAKKNCAARELVDGSVDMRSSMLREFAPEIEGGPLFESVHELA